MNSNLLSSPRPIPSPSVIPAKAGIQDGPSVIARSFATRQSRSFDSAIRNPQSVFPRDLRAEFDSAVAEYGKAAVLKAIVTWMEDQLLFSKSPVDSAAVGGLRSAVDRSAIYYKPAPGERPAR